MSNVKIVIGCSNGDEGKGLMTDYFASKARDRGENCVVVCSNGGSQRGHTVETPEGIRHVFHHFGSGTLVGAETYFPEYFIVNPMSFCREYKELISYETPAKPICTIHEDCLVSTPFDMIMNQIVEQNRGENRHGSCGCGIWETKVRGKSIMSTYGYMKNLTEFGLREYLKVEKAYFYSRLRSVYGIRDIGSWADIVESPGLIEHYIEDLRFMQERCFMIRRDEEAWFLSRYKNIIFENGQGLALDQNSKCNQNHTTPSNTGLDNPRQIINRSVPNADVEVCYVTRTYLTRHGAGPFPEECDVSEINPVIYDETNVPNEFQGSLRFGKIHVDKLRERVYSDFHKAEQGWKKSLAITHLNEYPWQFPQFSNEFDKVYESNGKTRKSVY